MGQRNSAVLGFLGLDLVSPLYFEDHLLCFLDFWDQLSNGVWTNCTGRVMGVVSCTGLTGLNTNPTTWIAVFAPKISFFLWYCIKWERKCGGLVSLLVTVCSYAKTMWALRWNLNRFAQILFQSSGLQRWGWSAILSRNWEFWMDWGYKNLKDRWSSEEGGTFIKSDAGRSRRWCLRARQLLWRENLVKNGSDDLQPLLLLLIHWYKP